VLPQVDNDGRVYVANLGVPVTLNGGIGYTATGQMCVTQTVDANDRFVGGWRVDNFGRVVVGSSSMALAVFNGGLPFAPVGPMVRQVDVVPAAADPYVGGIRVGPAGGAYFSTSAPA
jgi:hypothetical protein